ncbi:Metal-dependent hydrolase, endonuclease/exonuclease/phosphatase family [Salegentibacter echinorum]|uniref:Metal-dependent hydrolase, endonuclease/exonuclease/phosphatase family n=1 Tax=Salegentibacter echinorum TaxID=1073325 RepID=A0A1M5KXV6_SALEC|nr:endonuclease/exonuclease/phosphatase family protein [Salegentibacter echinorum]SHG57702.1 Metal-dependent hydrolase, endonuclease/exonuclease/phosphatase family [Salegentibacter echinorum]
MFRKTILTFIFCCFMTTLNAQIEFMTYNIRYQNENDGENSWSKRKSHLANQLKYHQPDIFGVQEALVNQLNYIGQALPGYEYLGVGRDGGEKGEFCAIFYDSEQFEVLQEDTFWLSETPNEISKAWDAAYKRICTYAKFKEKESGKIFWVFNTHFDHVGEQARINSAKLIWEKVSALNTQDLPVFVMGDLNLEPNVAPIKFLAEKMQDSKKIAQLKFGPEGTFNGYKFDEPVTRRIDYIFVNNKVEVLKYAVLSDSKDLKYPSDHLPVIISAEFLD